MTEENKDMPDDAKIAISIFDSNVQLIIRLRRENSQLKQKLSESIPISKVEKFIKEIEARRSYCDVRIPNDKSKLLILNVVLDKLQALIKDAKGEG